MEDRALRSLQAFIADAIASPSPLGAPVEGAGETDDAKTALAKELLVPGSRGLAPAARLEIYREQFWLRHLSNLRDDFPTVAWALGGAQAFSALATQYLGVHPPRTWNLQRLGADFPRFLSEHPDHGQDACACDAGHLDWAFVEAFDAPDAPPLDLSSKANAPEDAWLTARLVLHPSIRRLALAHPLADVRDALRRGESPARPPADATRVVVWRDTACRLRFVTLEKTAFDLLDALGRGEALGRACEVAASASGGAAAEDIGARVGEWFQGWTSNGWVSAVQFAG